MSGYIYKHERGLTDDLQVVGKRVNRVTRSKRALLDVLGIIGSHSTLIFTAVPIPSSTHFMPSFTYHQLVSLLSASSH